MITEMKIETNGKFIIIARKPASQKGFDIVLAAKMNLSEYVTWVVDKAGDCSDGHYISSVVAAAIEYDNRC